MYKRRFTAPLHPPAIRASSVNSQQLPCTQGQAASCLASAQTISGQHSAPAADVEKENAQPAVEDAVCKKPRLFARPAYKAPASTLAGPAGNTPRPPAADTKASDAAPARTFSVLYCNRNKFKVRCTQQQQCDNRLLSRLFPRRQSMSTWKSISTWAQHGLLHSGC